MLYDFYGGLLTEKQGDIFRMYYGEDMSLSEIADDVRMSRQGVYDALRRSTAALEKYERSLALVDKFRRAEAVMGTAKAEIERLGAERAGDDGLTGRLRRIGRILDGLEI